MISALPLDYCYINIKDLLNKARNIKDIKKNIVINFPKQEKFSTSRLNQRPRRLARKLAELTGLAGLAGLAKSAAEFIDTKKILRELIGTAYIQTQNLESQA